MREWRAQAVQNIKNWGVQSWPVLFLAAVEEAGELAQALLEYHAEDGDPERIPEELTDLMALFYAMWWKRQGVNPVEGRSV